MNTTFSCVGCGKCCNDHHVPLTLPEARMWAADGGQVIVLVEAFLSNGLGLPAQQREHAERRSAVVRSGACEAYVAITFAAYNIGACRNLDQDNLCRIYERRPLVCRIYPMEINPHIPLNIAVKECPPQSWETGPQLIVGGQLVDPELAQLIQRSRQADRDDIHDQGCDLRVTGDSYDGPQGRRVYRLPAGHDRVRHDHRRTGRADVTGLGEASGSFMCRGTISRGGEWAAGAQG